jgi:hypothetical protein
VGPGVTRFHPKDIQARELTYRSTANILRAVVVRPSLVAKIYMYVGDVDDLEGRFSAWSRASSSWFISHRHSVILNAWPLTETKHSQTKELGCSSAYSHNSEVMGQNRSFESNGSLTVPVSTRLKPCEKTHHTSSSSIPFLEVSAMFTMRYMLK